ncbi:hypothetical protein DXG01_014350 [Tephrocybe rancida]|nr:hypothetical protein DXG01_014350 [Tephrocybe rancida]
MALEEERNTALLERNAAQATIKQLRSKAAKIHRSAKSALICVEMAATDLGLRNISESIQYIMMLHHA